jgi:hypothetical protein
MFNKVFDDSQVVVFDEKGNIIETAGSRSPEAQKLGKDPNAIAMFETHDLAGDRVKSVWHTMMTPRQRTLVLGGILVFFFVFAWLVHEDIKRSNEKYNQAVQSRIARGCKYPTMVIQGSKEGYAVNPDEGCAPE